VNYDLTLNPYPSPILAVLWSISVEEQFYIFWPLLIALVPRKYLIYSLIGVLAATFLFRFMQWTEIASLFNTYQLGNVDVAHPANIVTRFDALRLKATVITRFHTFSILSDITMGALLAYGLFYSERLRLYFKNLPTKSIVLPYFLAIMLVIIRDETYSLRFYSIIPFVHALEPMLFSFVFAFIIGEQHYSDNSFYKFGKLKLMSEFGKYSYGMYIWHLVVIWIVFFLFKLFHLQPEVDNPWVFLTQIILCFLITLGVAKISYWLIEAPFLKLRNRFRSGATADHFIKD
jgi:peptidoglycan/LPS O-acetylase OafA/YrhL